MALTIGGIYNIPTTNYVQGFNTDKLQKITISSDDCDKYGIEIEDFNKIDKDKDGLISASEFLSFGIRFPSVFKAFKKQATKIEGAYTESSGMLAQNNDYNKNRLSNPIQQQKNSLTHPSIANHQSLGGNLDFSV